VTGARARGWEQPKIRGTPLLPAHNKGLGFSFCAGKGDGGLLVVLSQASNSVQNIISRQRCWETHSRGSGRLSCPLLAADLSPCFHSKLHTHLRTAHHLCAMHHTPMHCLYIDNLTSYIPFSSSHISCYVYHIVAETNAHKMIYKSLYSLQ
jgi:hypothetical protein